VLQIILELTALVILVGYLYWRFCLRPYREEVAREQTFRKNWHPTAFDASSISPRIEHLRHDASRPHHSRLIASVRDAILRLPYFRRLKSASQASNHHEPLA
jgi:hypothetical protein